jgi:hypothetical protein
MHKANSISAFAAVEVEHMQTLLEVGLDVLLICFSCSGTLFDTDLLDLAA